ncbi:hypothetical protein SRHO_G00069260 [Serrasalmus rhombeus]
MSSVWVIVIADILLFEKSESFETVDCECLELLLDSAVIELNLRLTIAVHGMIPPTDFADDSSGRRYRPAAGGVRFNWERKAWSGGTVNKTETSFTFPPFSHNNTRQRKAQRQCLSFVSFLPFSHSLILLTL